MYNIDKTIVSVYPKHVAQLEIWDHIHCIVTTSFDAPPLPQLLRIGKK